MTPCKRRVWRMVAPALLAASLDTSSSARQDARAQAQLDAAVVAATVESLGAIVKREYIDPDSAVKAEARLRQLLADGRFAAATTADALAKMLTRELFEVTHDKHLVVEPIRETGARPTAVQTDDARALAAQQSNYGVRRAEVLPGNIGILDLSTFYRPEEARAAIAAAMRTLSQTDALILDMRNNGGGSPGTVALLISYLLDQPGITLFEIVHRAPEPADRYTTESHAPADRNAATAGARADFVADVFGRRGTRVYLAGASPRGNRRRDHGRRRQPRKAVPVNDRFSVTVPNGRVRSAIGGGNWEGTGVTPDVPTTADEALRVAYARVIRRLIAHEPPGPRRDALQQLLANPQVKE